jgi:Uma2 family endonuclease
MAIVEFPIEQRLVLPGASWDTYTRFLRACADRPAVRLTFDRGVLELMTLSHEHEHEARLLGRLVVAITEELGLPVKSGGSTTFRRRKKQRGLEADECYWITNEPLVRDNNRINLRRDPPPDLGIEVDVTHSSLNRMGIYAVLRVPEVWRFDGEALTFNVLGADGKYMAQTNSLAFPRIGVTDVMQFLALRGKVDENTIVRRFRAWVRQWLTQGQG